MMTRLALALLLPLSGFAAELEPEPALMPPAPPAHAQRVLDTAADLARDLADTVAYLELGQAYFRAFKKGTHTAEENAALVAFLERHERERETARKEAEVLKQWTAEKSGLDVDAPKPVPPKKQP